MKFIFSFLAILLVVASCKDGSASNTIPLNTMKVIVWDMACADELFNERQARDSVYLKMPQERFKLYEQIFAVHKISKEKFYNNYRYYQMHTDEFKTLMDSVQAYGLRERYKPSKTILNTPISAVN